MNRFLKKNSNWLGLLALALFIVVLAFIFRPNPPEYRINVIQALKLMNDPSLTIKVNDIAGKQTIDIRSAELYAQGHVENSINVPARQILDKQSIKLFNQFKKEGKVAILYGTNELQVASPWLLLQQLGYKNIVRLKGGINSDNKLTETNIASSESSVLDTSSFGARHVVSPNIESPVVNQKPESVKLGKKASSSGGGC